MRSRLALPKAPLWAWISVLVCALLTALYAWSHGGQVTHVRIEVRGGEFATFVDGRPALRRSFDAAPGGGLVIEFDPADDMPSLPRPSGIDSVTLRAAGSGEVLFRDTFDGDVAGSDWRLVRGKVHSQSGVWEADRAPTQIQLSRSLPADYTVEIAFRNAVGVEVGLRATDPNSGVFLGLRPFRLADTSLSLRQGGSIQDIATKAPLRLNRVQTAKGMAAMQLRPLPLMAGLALVAAAAVLLASVAPWRLRTPSLRPLPWQRLAEAAAGGLALAALVTAAILLRGPAEGIAHVPDELSYIFQGKVLASGHFSVKPPPIKEAFEWSNPAPNLVNDGHFFSMYPPGQPLMLGIGIALHAMWLVPPLIGAACVYLVFLIGRRLYDARTGLLAAALFAISPFFLMTASNFMSHNTTALFLLLALYFLSRSEESPARFGALTGFFLAAASATRPLNGVAFAIPIGAFIAAGLLDQRRRKGSLRAIAGATAGGLAGIALYLLYQWRAAGDPFFIPSTQGGSDAFGFGGNHSLEMGLTNEQSQLAYLVLVLNNWTPALGLGLALLPFALGTANRWDWLLAACALCLMAAYTLYFVNGIMHGPRYWYEATPLLMLLTARAVALAGDRLTGLASTASRRRGPPVRPGLAGYAYAALALPVLLLALHGSYVWLFTKNTAWSAEFMPGDAKALKGFNGIDARMEKAMRAADLRNALVLADECGAWQCYGSVFLFNAVTFDGNIVVARQIADRPQMTAAVLAAYPGRSVYHANFHGRLVEPYKAPPDSPAGATPPRSDEIKIAVPTPAPAPESGDARARDARRLADLDAIAALLEAYKAARGSYPEARNPQTLCVYPIDAGCALKQFGTLPSDPKSDSPYRYWSDGASYIVVARLEASPSSCTIPLPPDLRQPGAVACVSSG